MALLEALCVCEGFVSKPHTATPETLAAVTVLKAAFLPWIWTVGFGFASIVAILVCRFLSSVVKVFSASADPIEVEECQSIKVRRLVKSLGNKLHSHVRFKASCCSPRSTRTGRLLRHVLTLKKERKSVSMAVLGSAKILARSVLELLGWALSGGSWKELSTTMTTDFFRTGNSVVYNWSRCKIVSQWRPHMAYIWSGFWN